MKKKLNQKIIDEIKLEVSKKIDFKTFLSNLGITKDQYYYILRHKNHNLHNKIKPFKESIMSITQIAKKYEISRETIYNILNHKSTNICIMCNKIIETLNGKKFCSDECFNKSRSDIMKKNNPMKNKITIDKVKHTLKEGYNSGRIKKTIGPTHWLYKGNRRFNLEIRSRLYKVWILTVLERDNFRCTNCNSKSHLHVHHVRPLRDIINMFLDIEDKEEKIKKIINEHKLEDGITLCRTCRSIIDERYRGNGNNTKKI